MSHEFLPSSFNDDFYTSLSRKFRVPRKTKRKSMAAYLTFGQLRQEMQARSASCERSPRTVANYNTALTSFMSQFGLQEDSVVASALRASFYKYRDKHLEYQIEIGREGAFISNRKNALKHWHLLVLSMDKEDAANSFNDSPFQKTMKDLVTLAPSQVAVATQAGISLATLKRWLNGARPNERARPSLRRLEVFFGLPSGELLELAFGNTKGVSDADAVCGNPAVVLYRKRLSNEMKLVYAVSPTEYLRSQWLEFVRYKTAIGVVKLPRQRNARWSISVATDVERTDALWYSFLGQRHVPTAGVAWQHVSRYLGWLSLPIDQGGAGLESDDTQTMAWFAYSELLVAYIEWCVQRSNNNIHLGIKHFYQFVRSLTNPKTGWLTNQPELMATLPEYAQDDWQNMCKASHQTCDGHIKAMEDDGTVERHRNPFDPLRPVLDMADPMQAVADMIHRMKKDRPLTGGMSEAVWLRDIVLIKILSSNPLRAKNLKLLTYKKDNTGTLYQREGGAWYIRVPRPQFKNARGAARTNPEYDMPVQGYVWGDLEAYLKIYRPMLATPGSDFVFVSSEEGGKAWKGLNRRVAHLTKTYLWRCPGVGPHSFRHIYATSILKKSPNDWETVARNLNDHVETVRTYYAHLELKSSAERAGNILSAAYARM